MLVVELMFKNWILFEGKIHCIINADLTHLHLTLDISALSFHSFHILELQCQMHKQEEDRHVNRQECSRKVFVTLSVRCTVLEHTGVKIHINPTKATPSHLHGNLWDLKSRARDWLMMTSTSEPRYSHLVFMNLSATGNAQFYSCFIDKNKGRSQGTCPEAFGFISFLLHRQCFPLPLCKVESSWRPLPLQDPSAVFVLSSWGSASSFQLTLAVL